MRGKIKKAYEISNAKIHFVSLVDKAANKKNFLIAKASDGEARFSTYGRVIKADASSHYITGIVYEPLEEDSQGNYMTEDEITKAAYWFAKNGDKVDLQHSFETLEEAYVVENWVAKADMEIDGENIKKGTWLMTIEVSDPQVWESVQKGEITGFSMGGTGVYGDKDDDLTAMEKSNSVKGIFKQLADKVGFRTVKKGEVADRFQRRVKSSSFWEAFNSLDSVLCTYDWTTDRNEFLDDEALIREALDEFSKIIIDLLAQENIAKALASEAHSDPRNAVTKAGKKMSAGNKEKLDSICRALGEFKEGFEEQNEKMEDEEMKEEDVKKMVDESIAKAVASFAQDKPVEGEADTIGDTQVSESAITLENIEKMVEDGVTKALAPLLKARGLASNLNEEKPIEKESQHYLAGIL